MSKKFKIMYPESYHIPEKRGKPYLPPAKHMTLFGNKGVLMKLKILTLMIVAMMVAGCQSEQDSRHALGEDQKIWAKTETGINYFYQCVDGWKFIVTPSTHGATQLAGPLGKCT